jgi:hypothetical protein
VARKIEWLDMTPDKMEILTPLLQEMLDATDDLAKFADLCGKPITVRIFPELNKPQGSIEVHW